jgi:hypothetical protein
MTFNHKWLHLPQSKAWPQPKPTRRERAARNTLCNLPLAVCGRWPADHRPVPRFHDEGRGQTADAIHDWRRGTGCREPRSSPGLQLVFQAAEALTQATLYAE